MYALARTNQFKRSFKKIKLTDDEEVVYIEIIYMLLNGKVLKKKYKEHSLKGNFIGYMECHIKPDLLLIYKIRDDTLELVDIGSHSQLFK